MYWAIFPALLISNCNFLAMPFEILKYLWQLALKKKLQNAFWRPKIPIRYWKIKVLRVMGKKKKKLKMHGTLHRESQGSLIYQIKRHIKKLSTNLWLTSRDYFIWWTCFHDEKRAFFLVPSRSERSFHFPSLRVRSGRESQAPPFSLCSFSSLLGLASVFRLLCHHLQGFFCPDTLSLPP